MKEILQKSDFMLKISFIDILGIDAKPTKFKFSYSTPLSTPIIVEFDGTNYSPNCRLVADGVEVIFDNPLFNVGQIKVLRQYTIQSDTFPDGGKDFTEVNWLPLEIVQSYSKSSPQTNTIASIDASNHDIIWTETVVVESVKGDKGNDGEKGDKGDKGNPGNSIDRTLLTEQLLPEEFWVDKTGAKTQLYGRRVKLSSKVINAGNETGYALFENIFYITGILSIEGFIIDDETSMTNMLNPASLGKDLYIVANGVRSGGRLADYLLIYRTNMPLGMIGRTTTFDLFIKYVK